jgi:2-polyprenyl-3-methyl-5-hydroxy-6-metoxy-1,4-benzoquinol methylase
MPFCVGAQPTANNPQGLPNTFPLRLSVDLETATIKQVHNDDLEVLLNNSYQLGVEMGTPTADSELGLDYARDFLAYIKKATPHYGRALEIGAGVGYISYELSQQGWEVDSIEPGMGYEKHWKKYGIEVINDFFPTQKARGPYDLILFYAVLEHIYDTETFLRQVADHLSPGGIVVLAVPDCTSEIEAADLSMLLHEHYQYFTLDSLRRVLLCADLEADVQTSGYGRCIYAVATPLSTNDIINQPKHEEVLAVKGFVEKVEKNRNNLVDYLYKSVEAGTVGIYCPARALSFLPSDVPVRFFDDSSDLKGKYYPPFHACIESKEQLIENPVDTLIIMSRTFGVKMANELSLMLPNTVIKTIAEITE